MEEVLAYRIKEGGYDNWSFKIFMEKLISLLKEKEYTRGKKIVFYLDNATSHFTNYVLNSFREENIIF